MQQNGHLLNPSNSKKTYLITINSLNKTIKEAKQKNYKSIEKSSRESRVDFNLSNVENQLLSKKIVNVQLNSQLFEAVRMNKLKNDTKKNQIIATETERAKSRSQERGRQIYRKFRGGVKVIAKYRYPLADQKSPMKKFIKIEKIEIPSPKSRSGFRSIRATNSSLLIAQNMKKTIDDYNKYLEKKNNYRKYHKRNHSTIIDPKRSFVMTEEDILTTEKSHKRTYNFTENFPIRKPLGRKEYFVFGLGDRNNPQNKVQYFRDFLWKINYSNSLHVYTPEQITNPYRAYIGPGNNYYLVKSVLKRRFWWTIVQKPEPSEPLNFLWTQLKQNYFYLNQKKSAYEVQSEELTFSQFAQPTLRKADSQTTKQPTPSSSQEDFHKRVFSKSDYYYWNMHLTRNEKTEQKINQYTYVKRLGLFHRKQIKNIDNSTKLRVHNHLESNFFIGNKKALFYNLRRYLSLKNVNPFSVMPVTFHISKGVQDTEFKNFKKYYEEIEKDKDQNLKNMWIVKPGENTNRGNGITVSYSLDDIMIRLKGRQKNSDGKFRTFIVQKYIERPLLYYRRKFDIRHYMLITCVNGIFKAYWYEEGYIRTSSCEFTTKYSKDPFVHLTNDAIQKNAANYGKYERGNKLSYDDFQKYIQSNFKNKKVNFFKDILPRMKEIAAESVRATYGILDQNRRQHNFELLGLDFMIDENFRPWLIEVNTNPCLQLSCSLLQKIIPQLIDNVFRICIDPLFPPPESWQSGKKIYFGENPLSQNKFQIIFDEVDDGTWIKKLYNGYSILDQKMGKIEEDDQVFEDDGDQNWENKK